MNYGIVKDNGSIEAPVTMKKTYNGVRGFNSLSPSELEQHGWYTCNVNNESVDEVRYIRSTYPECEFDGTTVTATYSVVEKPIERIKLEQKAKLSGLFKEASERPEVDTGLGFSVDGSHTDLLNFEIAHKYAVLSGEENAYIKASDNTMKLIAVTDYETIIQSIELNGIGLYQIKWAKEVEIESSLVPWEIDIDETFN